MKHVFLGGFAHSLDNMRDLARALSLDFEDCLFFTPDDLLSPGNVVAETSVRGTRSEASKAVLSLKSYLKDEERYTMYGWSLGGMFALEFCYFFGQNISRLVLLSSCASFVSRDDYQEPEETEETVFALADALEAKPQVAYRRFLRRCFGSMKPSKEILEEHLGYALSQSSKREALEYLALKDLRTYASRLSVPALIFHGSLDSVIKVDVARSLASTIPSAGLYVFDGMGHNLPLQCSARIAGTINHISAVH